MLNELVESAAATFQILCHVRVAWRAGHFSIEAFLQFSKRLMVKKWIINDNNELFPLSSRPVSLSIWNIKVKITRQHRKHSQTILNYGTDVLVK